MSIAQSCMPCQQELRMMCLALRASSQGQETLWPASGVTGGHWPDEIWRHMRVSECTSDLAIWAIGYAMRLLLARQRERTSLMASLRARLLVATGPAPAARSDEVCAQTVGACGRSRERWPSLKTKLSVCKIPDQRTDRDRQTSVSAIAWPGKSCRIPMDQYTKLGMIHASSSHNAMHRGRARDRGGCIEWVQDKCRYGAGTD